MHLFESLQRRQTWHVDILLYGTVCDSEWVVCFKGRKTKEERQHKAGAIREGAADSTELAAGCVVLHSLTQSSFCLQEYGDPDNATGAIKTPSELMNAAGPTAFLGLS